MHRSVNQVNTYQRCPRQYRFRYLDQLSSKPSEHLAIGSAFDDAMTQIIEQGGISELQPTPSSGCVQAAIQLMRNNALKMLRENKFDEELIRESMNVIFHLSKLIGPYWSKFLPIEGLTPVSTQHKINYMMDGLEAPVIGYIDMIAKSKTDNQLVIVDFKTTGNSGPSLDYKRQVWTYAKAIQQEFSLDYLPRTQLHMFAKSPPTLAKKKREDLGLEDLLISEYPDELVSSLYDDKAIQSKIGIHKVSYDEQEWLSFSELFFDLEFSLRFGHWPKNRTHYLCNPKFCSYWESCHSIDESICSLREKQQVLPLEGENLGNPAAPILDQDDEIPFTAGTAGAPPVSLQQPVESIEDFLGTKHNFS